jgi:hypothetical protein
MKKLLVLLVAAQLLYSCAKEAGSGGLAQITGHVDVQRRAVLSNASTIIDTVDGRDMEVYLVFGDNLSPDEKVMTNYNGDFSFQGLRPGEYTLYVYSMDTLGSASTNPEHMVVKETVKVVKRKEILEVGTLMTYDTP